MVTWWIVAFCAVIPMSSLKIKNDSHIVAFTSEMCSLFIDKNTNVTLCSLDSETLLPEMNKSMTDRQVADFHHHGNIWQYFIVLHLCLDD